jgi:hypothetical protein
LVTRPQPRAPIRGRRFRLLGYAVITAVWGTLAMAVVLLWFAHDMPRPDAALDAVRRPSLALQDRSGREIIGVWLGNDDNRSMKSVQGGGLPARLFHDIAAAVARPS